LVDYNPQRKVKLFIRTIRTWLIGKPKPPNSGKLSQKKGIMMVRRKLEFLLIGGT